MMKVLCILSSSSMSGGSSISFISLLNKLKNKEINIVVSCPCKGPVYDTLKNLGIETHLIPIRWNIYPPKKSLAQKFIFPFKLLGHYILNKVSEHKLYKLCKNVKPDILYTNVSVVNIGYNVAKKMNIPHVYHIREFQDRDFDMNIIPSKQVFCNILKENYNICITRSIQQHYDLQNNDKSVVIYDGIKDVGHEVTNVKKQKTFLFVGRLDEKKGILDVLKAYKSFIQYRKDYKLLICGASSSSAMDNTIKNYCKENNLTDYIDFLGVRQDVDNIMQNAHALIMASHFEGLGRVTAEAMFNKCLVMGRNKAGTKEQFDNGVKFTGHEIAIRWNTIEELVQKMLEVANLSTNEYNDICNYAFKTVNEFYTNEKSADSVFKFFIHIYKKSRF